MSGAAAASSRRALDWFSFFVADVHAGFGPFIAVYLASSGWTHADVGYVLSVGGLVSLAGQLPGGAAVDLVRSERALAGAAVVAIGAGAVAMATWPSFGVVLATCAGYAVANCLLLPSIAAISLGLAGHHGLAERLARNARFASLGGGITTMAMGLVGYGLPQQGIFLVTAALALPALLTLARIKGSDIDPDAAHNALRDGASGQPGTLRLRPLLLLVATVAMFHFANMPALQMFGGAVAAEGTRWATPAVAAAVIVSQAVVAAVSPMVGRQAEVRGRRPLLLACFALLAVRVLAAAFLRHPAAFIGLQVLDGCSAAILATVVPLAIADATRGSGHFNLAIGAAGAALGLGAAAGSACSGYLDDRFGIEVAFLCLAAVAAAALVLLLLLFPETRPGRPQDYSLATFEH